jgi:fused signal recognition particle receptor
LFESLKNKFSGTINKISDKLSSEEEDQVSPEKTDSTPQMEKAEIGDQKKPETIPSVETETVPSVEPSVEPENLPSSEQKGDKEVEKTSEVIKGDKKVSEEEDSKEDKKTSRFSIFRRKSGEEEADKGKEDSDSEDKTDAEGENHGILSFATHKTISDKDIDDVLFELELALLEGDVALEVAEQIVASVKEDLVGRKIRRRSDVADYTREALKKAISEILVVEGPVLKDLVQEARQTGEPLKIMFVGVNGTGKTTTIAKIADHYVKDGYKPVIAASDTFRAGAIEQISHHAEKVGVKIIRHQKGADPAAVAYDAVEHAKAQKKELVLIDTAGRMQTNINLMDEMKKIQRVVKPDLVIFVGDALTGNDAVEQARKFDEAVGVNGIILTKADADAKGGAALSIGHVINKPILFLGTGQGYEDIIEFRPKWMVEQVLGD